MVVYLVLPDLMIQCTLSKLDARLDLDQYGLVRGVLRYNLGENLDDLVPPEINVLVSITLTYIYIKTYI